MIRRSTQRLMTAGIATTAIILGGLAHAQAIPSTDSAEDGIRATVQEFSDAANSLDAERFVAQVCSRYAREYPVDELESQLALILAFSGGIMFDVTNIQVEGDTATGDLALTTTRPDADPDPPSETRFVLEDGEWKICEPNT